MITKYKFFATLLIIAVMFLSVGCKKGEDEEETEQLMTSFLVGEETVAAMQVEGKDIELADTESTEGHVYVYTGIEDNGAAVGEYVSLLTSEENGFAVVAEDYQQPKEEPDYAEEDGVVRLSKIDSAEENLVALDIEWTAEQCSISTSLKDAPESEGLTHAEAIEFMAQLNPKDLELDGTSMSEYNFYVKDGLITVDEMPCLCIKVYSDSNPEGTNDYLGSYFLTRDGHRVFKLDEETQKVVEMSI